MQELKNLGYKCILMQATYELLQTSNLKAYKLYKGILQEGDVANRLVLRTSFYMLLLTGC